MCKQEQSFCFDDIKMKVTHKKLCTMLLKLACRQLGRAIAGNRDSLIQLVELAYGQRGQLKHIHFNQIAQNQIIQSKYKEWVTTVQTKERMLDRRQAKKLMKTSPVPIPQQLLDKLNYRATSLEFPRWRRRIYQDVMLRFGIIQFDKQNQPNLVAASKVFQRYPEIQPADLEGFDPAFQNKTKKPPKPKQ